MDGFSELKTLYSQRINGLSELKVSPNEFLSIVEWLGNSREVPEVPKGLKTPLDTQLVLRVQLDAANGLHILEDNDWQKVRELVHKLATELTRNDEKLKEIEASLATTAPNLKSLLDSKTAARLVFQYGIPELATKTADSLLGRSSPLAQDPFVLGVPLKHQKQCIRMLAGKTVLAARVDNSESNENKNENESKETRGVQGLTWRKEIESRLAKLMAPPPSYKVKALPVPNTQTKSHRGGKRIRKLKQKNRPSQLAQEANLLKFASTHNQT